MPGSVRAVASSIKGLRPDLPARKAAGLTLQVRGADLAAALGPALDPDESEGIHDLRVASRRLRAAIDAYESFLPRRGIRSLRSEVRDLFRATGPARDLEVQIERLRKMAGDAPAEVRAGLTSVSERLSARYEAETDKVRLAVESFRDAEMVRRLAWFVWGATGVPPIEGSR